MALQILPRLPSQCSLPLRLASFVLFLLLHLTDAQQIGSFFTAIYINGAPAGAYQQVCSAMGQPNYCCGTGQSCAWDDAGKVACCASGGTCHGTAAYGAGNQGQYYAPVTTPAQCGGCCGCQPTATVYAAPPVATLTTSYYYVTPSTYVQQQAPVTTVVQQAPVAYGGAVSTIGPVACPTVSTLTYANLGAPVKTVGCFIIINEAEKHHPRGLIVRATLGAMGAVLGLEIVRRLL